MTAVQGHRADKAALSRRKSYRETTDCNGCAIRMIKAVGERLAQEDPEDLRLLLAVEHELAQAWKVAIAGQRRSGHTDGAIGEVLGTTRQAVAQRWPRRKQS